MSANEPLQVILIGAGRIAMGNDGLAGETPLSHAAAIRHTESAVLTGVVDSDPARRLEATTRGLPVFQTLSDVPDRSGSPEIVTICTPPSVRLSPITDALKRGASAVVVEKPLAADLKTAMQIASLARSQDVPIFVNFNRRTDTRIAAAVDAVRGRKPVSAHVTYGRGMHNYASHALDLLIQVFGPVADVRWICGGLETNADPTPSFSLRFEDGSSALFSGLPGLAYDLFDISIWCESSKVTFVAGGAEIVTEAAEANRFYNGYTHLSAGTIDRAPVAGFTEIYSTLAAYIKQNDPVALCSAEEALHNAAVLEAVRISAERDGAAVAPGRILENASLMEAG